MVRPPRFRRRLGMVIVGRAGDFKPSCYAEPRASGRSEVPVVNRIAGCVPVAPQM